MGAPQMQRQWPPGPGKFALALRCPAQQVEIFYTARALFEITDQFSEGQEATFRHPLPPGNLPRPRMPVQQVLVRAPIRQIGDPRMQGVSRKYSTANEHTRCRARD